MKIGKYHITSKYVNIKLTPRQRFYIFICWFIPLVSFLYFRLFHELFDLSPRQLFFPKTIDNIFLTLYLEKASAGCFFYFLKIQDNLLIP